MSEGEAKAIDMMEKMTPEQQAAAKKAFAKKQALDLVGYKKRLREGNDLKTLQVQELDLNIRYYKAKREWFDLREPMQKLDEEERMIIEEERLIREKMRIDAEETHKTSKPKSVAKKKAPAKKPEIIIPEVGKARTK